MKILWNIFKVFIIVVFCLILLGLVGGYIFLKNFDIKKYKTKIVSTANEALGRSVDFSDIDLRVSLNEGIRFNLKDLTISENPEFGTADFAKVKSVSIGLDLLSFINARQVSVPNISVESPEITLIRNAAGQFNVQTLGPKKPQASSSSTSSSSSSSAAALPAIFINSLRIENAKLNYIDRSIDPAFETAVSQLAVRLDRFSLSGPFSFLVEGAVLSPEKNLKIDGNAQLNLIANQAKLFNVRVSTDLGQFPLDELRRLPMLKGVPIPEVLEGKYTGTIKESVVSDKGLESLVLDSQLTSGKIVMKEVAPGISLDVSQIDLNLADFSLGKPFRVALKAAYMSDVPNIDLQGGVSFDPASQNVRLSNFTFATDLALWPLQKMKAEISPLKDLPLPQKLAGKLQTTVKDLSAGPKGLEAVMLDVQLQNGEVSLKEISPGINFDASKIDLNVRNFSLNTPFQVALQMAYLNADQNIALDGTVSYDLKTQDAILKNTTINVDLGALSLKDLKASVASLKDVPLPETLGGKLEIMVKNLSVGPQGLKTVLVDTSLKQVSISMKDVAPGVSFKASHIDADVRDFSLSAPFEVDVKAAYLSDAQNIAFNGNITYDMPTQDVDLRDGKVAIDLATLNFQELKASVTALKDVPLPESLAGDLNLLIKSLSAGAKGLNSMLVDVDLNNGAVSMKDVAPGISFAASKVGLEITGFSLGGPIVFHLNAAYLNAEPNIDIAGTAILDMAQQSVQLKNTKIKTELSSFSMDELRASVASLKDVPLPQSLKGQLNVVLEDMIAGAKGLVSLTSSGKLTQGSIKLKELAVPVDITNASFQTTETKANVDDFLISLGKGTVKGKLSVDEFLTTQSFSTELVVDGIDLAEIMEQKDAPVKVEGVVFANVKAQGLGSDMNSIGGDGTLEVKDAKLKDLNVIKTVFDSIKIPILPNLSQMVMNALPEEYKKQFEKPDTDFKSVKATISILAGVAHIDPIDVQSDLFAFIGKGDAGLDQAYVFDGAFNLSKDFSAMLVRDMENPFAYMLNEENVVSFPVHVKGKGAQTPVFEAVATLKDVTKNILRNKVSEELGKELGKVFGKNGNAPAQSAEPQEGAEPSQESQKSPEQQVIEGIFGSIFK